MYVCVSCIDKMLHKVVETNDKVNKLKIGLSKYYKRYLADNSSNSYYQNNIIFKVSLA